MSVPRRVTANTATFSGDLPAVARAAAAAGFDGLELWTHDIEGFAGGAPAVRGLLGREGLSLSALQVLRDIEGCGDARRAERLREAEAVMDLTAQVGAEVLLVCANVQDDSSPDRQEQIRDLRALADMAAARGLKIGFEPLAWSRWINRYETAWSLVEAAAHPALGLTVDCFHLFHQQTPAAFVDTIALDRIFLVQLCDALPSDLPAIELARHHRLFPGEGGWPIAELTRRLDARGYDGFYNLEVFNDRYRFEDPAAVARRGYASFRTLFEQAD